MDRSTRVLCIGNAIIDAHLRIHDANVHCRLDEKTCELCVSYGQKILLDSCVFLLGGNAANVSVGLSRLLVPSAICAEIGDDEFSAKIVNTFQQEGVDMTYLMRKQQMASSFSIGIFFESERTLFVEHVKRTHVFSYDTFQGDAIYLTSLGEEWKFAYQTAVDFVTTHQKTLFFNPGTVQLEAGYAAIAHALKASSVVFLNKEEATSLVTSARGITTALTMKDLLQGMQQLGSKEVVITDGKRGSFARTKEGKQFVLQALSVPIVEKTGAGDAFSTGCVAAILSGILLPQALLWGTMNAASVIGNIGAQTGLLGKDDMFSKLNQYRDLTLQEFG